jgi:hypothetical protein
VGGGEDRGDVGKEAKMCCMGGAHP